MKTYEIEILGNSEFCFSTDVEALTFQQAYEHAVSAMHNLEKQTIEQLRIVSITES